MNVKSWTVCTIWVAVCEGFDTGIKCLRDLITLGSNKMEIAAEAVAETEKVVTVLETLRGYL
jgi:hypothetical protein